MAETFGRNQALYFTLVGIVVGLLVAGLVVPLGFGTRRGDDFVAFDDGGGGPQRLAADSVPGDEDASVADGTAARDEPPATAQAGTEGAGAEPRTGGGATPTEVRQDPSAGGGGPTGEAAGAGPATGPRRATDRGVTADTILLGILVFDLGGTSALGLSVPGVDPEEQRESWDSWVADVNARGGIHGRRVEPSYYRYDVLNEAEMRAACLAATQDDGVFAALDIGAMKEAALCFTQENQTPLITQGGPGFTARHYQRSSGLLFSVLPEGERGLANFGWELHQLGELVQRDALGQAQNKPVGILSTAGPGSRQTIQAGMVDTLEQLGYEVAHWAELSEDMSVAAAQIPGAVNQMRANDVSAVLLLASVFESTQFVQQAEAQRFQPDYYAGDWAGMSTQTAANNMPVDFNGVLITASRIGELEAGYPDSPLSAECLAVYLEQTGREGDDSGDHVNSQWVRRNTCQMFRIFEQGAKAAGPELTRAGFSRGMQSVGEVPLAVHGGGSLAPGKFGIADLVRTAAFDSGCRCWLPVDDFRRGRW